MAPVTAGHEYETPEVFAQGVAVPEMLAGIVVPVTAVTCLQVELVPHAFPAYTQIFPVAPLAPKLTVIEEVPWPETKDAPVGRVQVKDVAPVTPEIEYTLLEVFAHAEELPLIAFGS